MRMVTICQSCNYSRADIKYDIRYNGYRATCQICGGNWPES